MTPQEAQQLAQTLHQSQMAVQWLVVSTICTLLAAVSSFAVVYRSFRPQKREVSFTEDYVKRSECELSHESLVSRVGGVEQEIKLVNSDLQAFKQAVIENGEARKNYILGEISKLHTRVDKLPNEIIQLLKNTGQLKGGRDD